jgi:hypothetical protein
VTLIEYRSDLIAMSPLMRPRRPDRTWTGVPPEAASQHRSATGVKCSRSRAHIAPGIRYLAPMRSSDAQPVVHDVATHDDAPRADQRAALHPERAGR